MKKRIRRGRRPRFWWRGSRSFTHLALFSSPPASRPCLGCSCPRTCRTRICPPSVKGWGEEVGSVQSEADVVLALAKHACSCCKCHRTQLGLQCSVRHMRSQRCATHFTRMLLASQVARGAKISVAFQSLGRRAGCLRCAELHRLASSAGGWSSARSFFPMALLGPQLWVASGAQRCDRAAAPSIAILAQAFGKSEAGRARRNMARVSRSPRSSARRHPEPAPTPCRPGQSSHAWATRRWSPCDCARRRTCVALGYDTEIWGSAHPL